MITAAPISRPVVVSRPVTAATISPMASSCADAQITEVGMLRIAASQLAVPPKRWRKKSTNVMTPASRILKARKVAMPNRQSV
jgi:hypothetical protein